MEEEEGEGEEEAAYARSSPVPRLRPELDISEYPIGVAPPTVLAATPHHPLPSLTLYSSEYVWERGSSCSFKWVELLYAINNSL